MTTTVRSPKAVENHSFSLGASVIDDELAKARQARKLEQDFWGSSMNFNAVQEGRIFGAFGTARNTPNDATDKAGYTS